MGLAETCRVTAFVKFHGGSDVTGQKEAIGAAKIEGSLGDATPNLFPPTHRRRLPQPNRNRHSQYSSMIYHVKSQKGRMHLGLVIPRTGDHDPTDLAVDAEQQGYDSIWMGELWGTNSVVKLTEIAARTNEVEIGTAIVNVFSRTPAVLAMTAATLDRVSDGRASLGVGTSTPRLSKASTEWSSNVPSVALTRPSR